MPVAAHQVLAVGVQHRAALAVEGRDTTSAGGAGSPRRPPGNGTPAREACGRSRGTAGRGPGHSATRGCSCRGSSLGRRAAFPAAEVAVLRPEARRAAEDGHLRADAVQEPVGQVRTVERLLIEPRAARQLGQIRFEILGHRGRVFPPVAIHHALAAPRAGAVIGVGEVPSEEEGYGFLLARRQPQRHRERAVARRAWREWADPPSANPTAFCRWSNRG